MIFYQFISCNEILSSITTRWRHIWNMMRNDTIFQHSKFLLKFSFTLRDASSVGVGKERFDLMTGDGGDGGNEGDKSNH